MVVPKLTATPGRVRIDATAYLLFVGPPNVSVSWDVAGGGLVTGEAATDAQGAARGVYEPNAIGDIATITVTFGSEDD